MSISNLHISHNAPCLPAKILHALCFSFLLGIIPVPRETEKHCLCEQFLFWQGGGGGGGFGSGGGQIRCIMGDLHVANEERFKKLYINRFLTPDKPAGN